MMYFVESGSFDPEYNLSFEEYIFKYLPLEDGGEYVSLWKNAPSVIIGKNQNAWAEINEKFLSENDIKLVRRITGGGAVYHDLGNLNFSFITKDKGQGKIDFSTYYKPIVDALRAMGVKAELSGRNDITVDGKKVIGASQSIWKERVLSNGCILFDVRMENLASALNVREEKLISKGVQSVRARVTNIKPYLPHANDIDDFKALLLKEIYKRAGQEPKEYRLSENDIRTIEKIKNERFGTREWNWGNSPKGTYKKGVKFPYGWVELAFDIIRGKLKNISILGDFFGTEDVNELSKTLENSDYTRETISTLISKHDVKKIFGESCEPSDVVDLFFE